MSTPDLRDKLDGLQNLNRIDANYPENIFPSKKDIGTTRLDSVTFILGSQFTLYLKHKLMFCI